MLPDPKNYAVLPAVYAVGEQSLLTIVPTERAFLFPDGAEYEVTVIQVDGDEPDYYARTAHVCFTACAEAGVLCFSYCFREEGMYHVLLSRGEDKVAETSVYALGADLYTKTPLRADFHSHSFRSDGKRDPAALAGHFREMGYDAFALTDHNRAYPGDEIDEVYADLQTSLCRVPGEEIHVPGYMTHIIHLFGKESVTEQYIRDPEGTSRAIREDYLPRVPADVPEVYRERYAAVMWATERIHAAGGIAVFPHPFWCPGGSRMRNVRYALARIYLKSGLFDAYELLGGMGQTGNNRSIALWAELRAEGVDIPVVGSGDVHGLRASCQFPHLFTVCFAESNTPEGIRDAILSKYSVAVEASGTEYERRYRAYGSFRLVDYTHFLLAHYFPTLWRIAAGEGVAMRAYAMDAAPAALVELSAQQAADYTARFFGRLAVDRPAAEMLAFEDKWRARHREGPDTRGARITGENRGRQI